MAERPILFSGPMVRAILEGRKTQTRRVLNPQPPAGTQVVMFDEGRSLWAAFDQFAHGFALKVPYAPGDLLWVRETTVQTPAGLAYVADGAEHYGAGGALRKRPAIHMPREFSRITLRVTDVRVQRLQEISEEDALAEGVPEVMEGNTGDEIYCPRCDGNGVHGAFGANYGVTEVDCRECKTAVLRFRNLWDQINAKRGHPWESNPWIAAISFERSDNG